MRKTIITPVLDRQDRRQHNRQDSKGLPTPGLGGERPAADTYMDHEPGFPTPTISAVVVVVFMGK